MLSATLICFLDDIRHSRACIMSWSMKFFLSPLNISLLKLMEDTYLQVRTCPLNLYFNSASLTTIRGIGLFLANQRNTFKYSGVREAQQSLRPSASRWHTQCSWLALHLRLHPHGGRTLFQTCWSWEVGLRPVRVRTLRWTTGPPRTPSAHIVNRKQRSIFEL